jgi:hypothetical protein
MVRWCLQNSTTRNVEVAVEGNVDIALLILSIRKESESLKKISNGLG